MSPQNVTLLTASCSAHLAAAGIYRRAGDTVRWTNHLAAADEDGRWLGRFSGNPDAAKWRIWQLELAGRDDDAFRYMEWLNREQKGRHPQIQVIYGVALLLRGRADNALEAYDSVPHSDWIASVRPLALFELPERRDELEKEVGRLVELHPMMAPAVLLYSGRQQQARDLARDILANQTELFRRLPPADRRAVEYLAGRQSDAEFLGAARGSLFDLCAAHCLVGFQRWANGYRAEAAEHFRQAVETRAFLGPVYDWARIALAQLDRHPTWPPEPRPKN